MAKRYLKLSKVLQKLLYDKRMNASELAREVDLPVPTVHRLVTGKSTRPYSSSLKPIADYFSLEVDQLLGEQPIPEWEESDAHLPNVSRIKTIPILNWKEVDRLEKAIQESERKIAVTGNINEKCFALLMNDHSMEPLFPKHTILIFNPLKQPVDRSYVLVRVNEKMTVFRQLLIDVDHKYLKPLNPDLNTYQMRLLTEKDCILASLIESRINHETEMGNTLEALK